MRFDSRRNFIKGGVLTSLLLITYNEKLFGAVTPLQTISLVQKDLFPSSSFEQYIIKILNHSHVTDERKIFIKNGAKWLNEEAVEMYDKIYTKLFPQERQKVLKSISQDSWGESWIKTIMSYIFEVVLGDPIYGGNLNESGWKWLNHTGGLPRPKKAFL